ncbi:MAG: MFS transporter [Alphaproteobacteria bacterium]|nr:MFS transporter [Alphaproteobacteria bacterium]
MPDAGGTTVTPAGAVEGRGAWTAAAVALAILAFSYGSPLLITVGLKPITAGLDTVRQVTSLAAALTWVGTGAGGILMGWLADRIGIRRTVLFGAAMIAAGLAVSAIGTVWALFVGHGLLLGLLGNGAMFPPLLVYVSRWFDRRRGTALALIASGQYIAGMVWPTVFEHAMARYGWQATMIGYGIVVLLAIPPLALCFLHPAPAQHVSAAMAGPQRTRATLGLRPNLVLGLLCAAGFCCCVPMALPQSHLVAFCTDVGVAPATSALMLSVLQAAAFCSRQFWGWLADRVGGLLTLILGSACQALAIAAFLLTKSEAGLFTVSAAFGLGFSGIVPAYVLIVRELFPSAEAAWRVPMVLFVSMGGMAFGSWFAGALYDNFGYYAPAFAVGVAFNLANLTLIGFLLLRQGLRGGMRPAMA